MCYQNRISSKFKCVIFCGTVLLLVQCLVVQMVQANNELSQLRDMWNNGRYSEVLPLLITYRKGPYGRNLEVDYMIATSLCRIPDSQELGYKYFGWILANYSLDEKSREVVEKEMRQSALSNNQPILIAFKNAQGRSSGGVKGVVRGKTFYWLDENSSIISEPIRVIRDISIEELTSRLFEPSNRESGVTHVKEQMGPQFKVEAVNHFILTSSSGHTQAKLQGMGQSLEKVLRFFASQYKMPIPSYLITIYLVPDTWELQKLAEKIHGIEIWETSIGYSFQDDLSIVGVIPSESMYVGTLAHELFHLMVRNDFGDIPPWMDEGMAALYEVMKITENSVVGLPNWRGRVLKEFWNLRPSIEELLKMDWRSFDEENGYVIQQATNHAMARYFILYLQDKKKLVEVYNIFRDRKVEDVQKDPGTDAMNLLKKVLQQTLSKVDKDFTQWFNSLSNKQSN